MATGPDDDDFPTHIAYVLAAAMQDADMGDLQIEVFDVDQHGGPNNAVSTRAVEAEDSETTWDNLLGDMGFVRTGPWAGTDTGYAADVTPEEDR